MQSTNFEILRNNYPEMADLGGFAEQYVGYSDESGRFQRNAGRLPSGTAIGITSVQSIGFIGIPSSERSRQD